MAVDRELRDLIEKLIVVGNSVKGIITSGDYRLEHAEGLLLKFVCHCLSIDRLLEGMPNPIVKDRTMLDPASINVLTRAAVETFLTFQYIFVLPRDRAEKDLRYAVWLLSGRLELIDPEPILDEHLIRLPEIKREIGELRIKISANSYIQSMPRRMRESILNNGNWKLPYQDDKGIWHNLSYVRLMTHTGFSDDIAKMFYRYLSGYSHSGNLSVDQLLQAIKQSDREIIIDAPIGILKEVMNFMIDSYQIAFKP